MDLLCFFSSSFPLLSEYVKSALKKKVANGLRVTAASALFLCYNEYSLTHSASADNGTT